MTYTRISFILALICAGAVLFVTARHGIGFSTDLFAYIQGATDLRNDGLASKSETLTKFPPLPALTLTLIEIPQVKWLNMSLLAANVFAFSQLLLLTGVRHYWLAMPIILAVGIAPEMTFRHSMIMSEPLFLLLIQLAIIALMKDRFWWAVLFVGLAPLQRYAGIVLIAACVIYLFLYVSRQRALLMGVIATAPVMVWLARGSIVADRAGREFVFHPISRAHLIQGMLTLGGRFWFLPALLIVVLMAYFNRNRFRLKAIPPIIRFSLIFCLLYLTFLVISISFFDFDTPLSSRILSPVLLLGWPIIAWLIETQFEHLLHWQKRFVQLAFTVMIIGFLTFGVVRLVQSNQTGIGLISEISPSYFETLASISHERPMYSNHTGIMLVMMLSDDRLADLSVLRFPEKFAVITQQANPTHDQQLQTVIQQVQAGNAIIVWFSNIEVDNIVTAAELQALLPYQDYDGLLIFGRETAIIAMLR